MPSKSNMKVAEVKQWRFYRSNLETIVWNPDTNSRLADFSKGHFTTDDPKVAKRLKDLGYVEIPLDAEEPPPDIMVRKPQVLPDDINVPIIRGNNEVVGQNRTEAFRESISDTPSPPKTKSVVNALPKRNKKKSAKK